jgi:hypothetical protein
MNRRSASQRVACVVFALGGLTGLAACTALKSGNVLPDAGAASTSSSACTHAEPPAAPTRSSAPATEHDYVFASSDYDVGDTKDRAGHARYPSLGYDLDHTCSGAGQGASCKLPAWQTSTVVDGPGGRDNSANEVFFLATDAFGGMTASDLDAGRDPNSTFVSFDSNIDAQSGRTTVVLRLRGYNGERDDAAVALDMFSGTLWTEANGGPKPRWDTHDRWHTTLPWLEDGTTGNDAPRFSDAHAYVSGDVLVAHLDSLVIGNAFVPAGTWRKVVVTGRLSRATSGASDDALALHDVTLTGRWPIDDLLSFVARTQDADSGAVRCADRSFYDAIRPIYCQNVDLSAVRDDGSAACDAVSIVFAMDTVRAELAEPLAAAPPSWPDCAVLGCDGKPLPAHSRSF